MPETAETIVPRVRQISRELVRELDLLAEPSRGCSIGDCHALIELDRFGELSVAQLARHLRLEKSTVSRRLARLARQGLLRGRRDRADARVKRISLTARGRRTVARIHRAADRRVGGALAVLAPQERDRVVEGFRLYVDALSRSGLEGAARVRALRRSDDADLAYIIRTVMTEFDIVCTESADFDPEIDRMYRHYRAPRHAYFVATVGERIVGGGGIAPLAGGDDATCELQKMYLLPAARGRGLGLRLLERSLDAAREAGFERCYLETMANLTAARALYERAGFEAIASPLGATGQCRAQNFYLKRLS